MSEMHFSEEHEWVVVDGDIAAVGITNFAQEQLGDVVFVDLPDTGKTVAKCDEVAVVESVKAAAEVYSPLSGDIVETNDVLDSVPETVNSDPQAGAWFFKIKMSDPGELDSLMDAAAYDAFASNEG